MGDSADDRRQMTDDRKQTTEVRRRMAEDGVQTTDDPSEIRCAVTNVNFTGQAEGRGQKERCA